MDSKAQDDKVAAPASALLRECRDKGLDALSQTIAPGLRPEPWHAIYFALREITGRIDAHLAAGSGEGWVSVPVEPTQAMERAGVLQAAADDVNADLTFADCAKIYRAMLAAAPKPDVDAVVAELDALYAKATKGPWDGDEGVTPFYNDAEGNSCGGHGDGIYEIWSGFGADGEPNFVNLYAVNNGPFVRALVNAYPRLRAALTKDKP